MSTASSLRTEASYLEHGNASSHARLKQLCMRPDAGDISGQDAGDVSAGDMLLSFKVLLASTNHHVL